MVVYPAPEGEKLSEDFELKVAGRPVPVYQCRVSAMPFNQAWPGYQRPLDQTELASFAYWDASGPADVEVISHQPVESVAIRPTSRGIQAKVDKARITFRMPGPGQVTVEVNGWHKALHLFANPPAVHGPDPNAPGVRYFGPGLHKVGRIALESNQVVYLAGGAVVHGSIQAQGASNIRILGRGILDTSAYERGQGRGCIRLTSCRDVGNDGQGGEDYVATYAYDLVGNRLSKVFDSADNELDETISYAYNSRDELTAEDSSLSGNDVAYTYDANGSTLTRTKGEQDPVRYVWDLRNRMVGLDSNGDNDTHDAGDAEYGYDSGGVRVSKTLNPTTEGESQTVFVVDEANPTGYAKPLEEKSSPTASPTRGYILGLDVIGQADGTSSPVYLLADGDGTTQALLNSSGAVTAVYDYDAFGDAIGFDANSAATGFQSADGFHDAESGLDYNLARYRQDGRFLSMDPINVVDTYDPISLHKYMYASANPVNKWDPSGSFTLPETLSTALIQGGDLLMKGGSYAMSLGYTTFVSGLVTTAGAALEMAILYASGVTSPLAWQHASMMMGVGVGLMAAGATIATFGYAMQETGRVMRNIGIMMSTSSLGSVGLRSSGDVRVWYDQQVRYTDTSGPLTRDNAERVHAARNVLKLMARNMMADRDAAEQLARDFPLQPFQYYVDKYTAQGYEGAGLWQRIIQGATTANQAVNQQFGID